MPALAVAKSLEDDAPSGVMSPAAVAFLNAQRAKPIEQRVSDLELWQVGANEMLAELATMHKSATDFMDWAKRQARFWLPVIGTAAIASGMVGGKGAAFLSALLKAAGFPVS